MTVLEFWGRREVADYLEVKINSLNRYPLPPEDVRIGRHRGWKPETIRQFKRSRPGKGNWKDDED